MIYSSQPLLKRQNDAEKKQYPEAFINDGTLQNQWKEMHENLAGNLQIHFVLQQHKPGRAEGMHTIVICILY